MLVTRFFFCSSSWRFRWSTLFWFLWSEAWNLSTSFEARSSDVVTEICCSCLNSIRAWWRLNRVSPNFFPLFSMQVFVHHLRRPLHWPLPVFQSRYAGNKHFDIRFSNVFYVGSPSHHFLLGFLTFDDGVRCWMRLRGFSYTSRALVASFPTGLLQTMHTKTADNRRLY